mmetsp:Transcript_47010/g.152378  ORF Transcript_47010/g.152378 Transcript_47010/m.152378 type:complete len:250 (-) Transcript_47010:366-1115(-)
MGKGKENSSGKEKKLARAAALAAEKERKQHIAQAAAITTPLSAFEPMVKAAQAKFGVDVVHAASASLSEADHDFCFALLKRNMESLRLDAGWGFNDSGERATLRDEESHFLILRPSGQEDAAASPAGFCMYRWILEGECTVLYVYELQLTAEYRGKGLGKFVMQLLELLANKHKMQFIMLTVFKNNDGAMRFYLDRLKYSVDETSPSRCAVDDESSYEILSKCLDKELLKGAVQGADDLGPRLRNVALN